MSEMEAITRPGRWELRVEVWRSVMCGSCDYMAREWLSPPAAKANGCCTKCGHIWSRDLTRDEQREATRAIPQIREVPPEAMRELEAFEARLCRENQVIATAEMSLIQRVREFVDKHGRNGSKTGRPDYAKFLPLDAPESMRLALDEYDRVRSAPRQQHAEREKE